jgi:uncharacterized protein (TIRG00374 family)
VKLALRIGISLVLIVLLFAYVVDAGEVVRTLQRFHPTYIVLALAVATFDRILMTYKWALLLKAQGHDLPLFRGVMIYCSSMVWGLALPATVGADAIRALMLTRRGISGTDVVTSIVVERMLGFVLALALGLVSLLILRSIDVLDARYDQVLYVGIALLAGTIALALASMNERLVAFLMTRLPRRLRESKIMHQLQRFTSAYHALGNARRTIVLFSGLTVAEQVFAVVFPWTLALGLGVPADLLLLLGVLPLSILISRLPISFDGLGVFEAVFIGLMLLAGIPAESALAIAISGRILQLIAFLPWWLAQVVATGGVKSLQRLEQSPLPAKGQDF